MNDGRYEEDVFDAYGNPIGEVAASDWLYVYPAGLRQLLGWIGERYNQPDIYVFENGVSAPGEANGTLPHVLNDTFRINCLQHYMANVVLAMMNDGVKVKGYFAWSIIDTFEWADGFDIRFGMVYVDYTSKEKTRYNKASSYWFGNATANIAGGQNVSTVLEHLGVTISKVNTTYEKGFGDIYF